MLINGNYMGHNRAFLQTCPWKMRVWQCFGTRIRCHSGCKIAVTVRDSRFHLRPEGVNRSLNPT